MAFCWPSLSHTPTRHLDTLKQAAVGRNKQKNITRRGPNLIKVRKPVISKHLTVVWSIFEETRERVLQASDVLLKRCWGTDPRTIYNFLILAPQEVWHRLLVHCLPIVVRSTPECGHALSLLTLLSCLLYTSPSPRDRTRSRMPSSA